MRKIMLKKVFRLDLKELALGLSLMYPGKICKVTVAYCNKHLYKIIQTMCKFIILCLYLSVIIIFNSHAIIFLSFNSLQYIFFSGYHSLLYKASVCCRVLSRYITYMYNTTSFFTCPVHIH